MAERAPNLVGYGGENDHEAHDGFNQSWLSQLSFGYGRTEASRKPLRHRVAGDGRSMQLEHVMTNNFAFGGVNTSLIFQRWH
jgi:hypothetical protein